MRGKVRQTKKVAKLNVKIRTRVLDLSQKHPIWAPLALVMYEC